MHEHSLSEWIAKSQQGDAVAFGQIVALYQSQIFAYVFRLTGNENDAKDVVQETFLRAWTYCKTYQSRFRFSTWLYTIATNCSHDYLHTKKKITIYAEENMILICDQLTNSDLEQELSNVAVPVGKYLSAEEAGYWLTGKPDILKGMNGVEAKEILNNIEEKAEKWLVHNVFEMQYNELLKHLELIANHPSKDTMGTKKDSVFAMYYAEHVKERSKLELIPILDKSFKTQVFGNFAKAGNDSLLEQINKPEAFEHLSTYFDVYFDYKLVMPGDIIESNGILSHDTLNWKIDTYRLLDGNYTIEASSKKANIWAFFAASFIVVAAIVLFFIKRK